MFILIGAFSLSTFTSSGEVAVEEGKPLATNTTVMNTTVITTFTTIAPIEVVRDEVVMEEGVKVIMERPAVLQISRLSEPIPNLVRIYVIPTRVFAYGSWFAVHLRGGLGYGIHFPPAECLYVFLEVWVKVLSSPWKLIWQVIYPIKGWCPGYPPGLKEGERIFTSLEVLREEEADLSKLSVGEEKLVGEYNVYVLAEDKIYGLLSDKFTDRGAGVVPEAITKTLTTTVISTSTLTLSTPYTTMMTIIRSQTITLPSTAYVTTTETRTIIRPETVIMLTTVTASKTIGATEAPSEHILMGLALAIIVIIVSMALIMIRGKRISKPKPHQIFMKHEIG